MKLGEILAQQLALLPVQDTMLRTVVRTAPAADAFAATVGHARTWLETNALALGLPIAEDAESVRRGNSACRVEIERSEQQFAFALERQDERDADRRWLVESVVTDGGDRAEIDVRLSVVRPQNASSPFRYVPPFLEAIADDIGLEDVRALSSEPWFVDQSDVENFLGLLTSPERSLAVVAVSSAPSGVLVPPAELARRLVGVAHTVVLSERASWAITADIAQEWSVFLGAVRRYAPGLRFTDDIHKHRLWVPTAIQRANAENPSGGFIEQCISSIFAGATADFETAIPLPTLRDVAQEREEERSRPRDDGASALVVEVLDAQRPRRTDVPINGVSEAGTESAEQLSTLPADTEEEASGLERRVAELEQALAEERRRLDDAVRQRDDTIQSLQATNANLAGDNDLVQSLLAEEEAENRKLKFEVALLRGESGAFEGPMSGVLRSIAEALQRVHEMSVGVQRRDEQIAALQRDFETLAAERDAIARERHGLRVRLDARETDAATEPKPLEPIPDVDGPADFEKFIARLYGSRIVVTNAARKSFRDLVYLDRSRLFDALDILGTDYVDMRSGLLPATERREAKTRFEERLRDMRLTSGHSATAEGAGHYPEDHVVQFEGRTLPCEKIRDIGISFDRQRFLCIYFAWDDESARVILKGFGHGATISAHT